MDRGWALCVCLATGCMLEPTVSDGSTEESEDTGGSSSASTATTVTPTDTTPGQTSANPTADDSGTSGTTSSGPGDDDTTSSANGTWSTVGESSSSTDGPTSSSGGETESSASVTESTSSVTASTSSDASTGSSSGGEDSSSSSSGPSTDGSSSGDTDDTSTTTGDPGDGCYTEAWSVVVEDVSDVVQVAAIADGLVYATGPSAVAVENAWVGAWDQAGTVVWSREVDAAEFGLAEDEGTVDAPAAVDIDVLAGGDALLAFQDVFSPTSAVFVRLDAATGDTVWATVFGEDELAPIEPMFGIYGSTPFGAAVTGSGRTFVVGLAPSDFNGIIYTAELDLASGAALWLTATDTVDTPFGLTSYESRGVVAQDDAGIFYGDFWAAFGPAFGGDVHRVSLEGEALADLGPEDLGVFRSLAIDDAGELALSWVAISSFDSGATWTPYVERRSSDFTLLAGGTSASPELEGKLAYEADGGIVLADAELTRLDASLNVVSVDDLDASVDTIATQSDGSLVLGGTEAGQPVVQKYDGCEP